MPRHPLAVLDLETTGFRSSDRVLEIGVVLLDRDLHREGSWHTLVQPARDIANSHVHGISASDLVHAPGFAGVAVELAEVLDGRVIVAHNAAFDTKFLAAEYGRLGVELPPGGEWSVCTRRLARTLLPGAPERLSACMDTLGLSNEWPHHALADAEVTAELFRELVSSYGADPSEARPLGIRELLAPHAVSLPGEWTLGRETATTGPASWLERLAVNLPPTGLKEIDDYRTRLHGALLDARLSTTEIEQLVASAHDLGITADEAREIHADHLRQLAVEAWDDGVVTDTERRRLHDIALQLGVDARQVDALLAEQPTGGEHLGPGLRPGDRVSFTGALELGRDVWEARARAVGLDVGGVTRASAVLVAANPDTMSGKARAARGHGVPIIDEPGFARLLRAMEEDRDVVDRHTPGADEHGVSHHEVFPWLVDLGLRELSPEEIAETWLNTHREQPLSRLSPRLRGTELPESPTLGRGLVERWLSAHPQLLSATAIDLQDLPGFGHLSLHRAVLTVVLAALDAPADTEAPALPAPADEYHDLPGDILYEDSAAEGDRARQALRTIAEWTWLVHGRPTLTDAAAPVAVTAAVSTLAADRYWSDPADDVIRRARAEIAAQVGNDPRDLDIFRDRLLGQATLDEIGSRHGVTRERIRQLELQLKERLSTPEPATDLVLHALPRRFGPLCLRSDLLRDLPALGEESPAVGHNMLRTLAFSATDWELSGRWFQHTGFDSDLDAALEDHADDYGVAPLGDLAETLNLGKETLRERLSETDLRVLDDHVLTRVRSYGDRGTAILALAGEPLAAAEILDRYGSGNIRSLANAMGADERTIRIGRDQWALAEWGQEEYTTLADWIGRRVDEKGAVPIQALIDDATATLGVSASSVRSYASTLDFTLTDGLVTRATHIQDSPADPTESAGLYRRPDGWRLLTTVTHDHLRGSGTGVPRGVGAILDVPALEKRTLDSPLGEQTISHSRTGVAVGSIRRFLQELDSREGERIWLLFTDEGGFDVRPACPRREGLDGIAEVLNATGLADVVAADDPAPLERINEAVGLAADAPRRRTVSRFRHRRQDDIADLIAGL